jgi:hypothetical protein
VVHLPTRKQRTDESQSVSMTNVYSVQLFIQTTEANDVAIVADRGKEQLLEAVHVHNNIDTINSAIWGPC